MNYVDEHWPSFTSKWFLIEAAKKLTTSIKTIVLSIIIKPMENGKATPQPDRYTLKGLAGVAKLADAPDLKTNLSVRRETGDTELLKIGETCEMAIPSQARTNNPFEREGVETRRAAPKTKAAQFRSRG